jgi:ElaB/YqjD/DUF883 family membrane-anchored ribosome-binding protein
MVGLKGIREELEKLRLEIMEKKSVNGHDSKAQTSSGTDDSSLQQSLQHQIDELNRMVKSMLDEAETTVSDHPVATVAGALALGIVVGRLTAR